MGIGPRGWAFLAVVGLVLPILARQTAKIVEDEAARPPRRAVYAESVLWLSLLALAAWHVAGREGISLARPGRPVESDWILGAVVLGPLLVAGLLRWAYAGSRDRGRLAWIVPRRAGDWPGWIGVSLSAGVGEELAYRGVLYGLLERLVGPPAAVLAAAAFAAGHAYQGAVGVAIVFAFALAFQGLALATGGVIVPIVVHALYDLAAGGLYGRLAGREGPAD